MEEKRNKRVFNVYRQEESSRTQLRCDELRNNNVADCCWDKISNRQILKNYGD